MTDLLTYINTPEFLANLTSDRFFLILAVIMLSSLKHSAYKSMWLTMLINLPGTILHECAHLIVGFLLNARPVSFSLFPKKAGDNYVTGQVGFSNLKFYNALPTSLAPLLLLVFAFLLNKYFFELIKLSFGSYLLYIFLLTVIIENAMPSRTDFKQGFGYISGNLLYLLLSAAAFIALRN